MSINYSKKTTSLVEVSSSGPVPLAPPAPDTLTYEPFFGLNEKPFSLDADPRFIFASPTHDATRKGLLAGIRRREGLLVLTGEIGTGKTTLCRTVLRELGRNTYSSLVPDPFAAREDLLKMLLIDFGVLSIQDVTEGGLRQASRTELGYLLSDFLNKLPREAFAVLIIDEAQNLSLPLIEETRILFDSFGAKGRLQILFVGQPELHAKLKLPEMRQVDQRICGYHRLSPMSGDAVAGYIAHRLQAAGASPARVLFPAAVVEALHKRTGGVPRLINRVCDRALQLAYERQLQAVNQEIFEAALIEVGNVTLSPTWDSIIFANGPANPQVTAPTATLTPAPVVAPAAPPAALPVAPPPAPVAARTAPRREMDDFQKDITTFLQEDLASPPAAPALIEGLDEAALPPRRPAASAASRAAAQKRPAVKREVRTDWHPDVRSETYIHRFMRIWARRGLIALAAVVAANLAVTGASMLLSTLEPATVPPAPTAPAKILPAIELPEVPDDALESIVLIGVDANFADLNE